MTQHDMSDGSMPGPSQPPDIPAVVNTTLESISNADSCSTPNTSRPVQPIPGRGKGRGKKSLVCPVDIKKRMPQKRQKQAEVQSEVAVPEKRRCDIESQKPNGQGEREEEDVTEDEDEDEDDISVVHEGRVLMPSIEDLAIMMGKQAHQIQIQYRKIDEAVKLKCQDYDALQQKVYSQATEIQSLKERLKKAEEEIEQLKGGEKETGEATRTSPPPKGDSYNELWMSLGIANSMKREPNGRILDPREQVANDLLRTPRPATKRMSKK